MIFLKLELGLQNIVELDLGKKHLKILFLKYGTVMRNFELRKKQPLIASIFGRSIFSWGLRKSFSSEKVRWGFFPERSCLSKYGDFSGLYFPLFGLNTEIYSVNLGIQSEYGKIRPRKTSVFGQFSHSVWLLWELETYSEPC